MNKQEILNRFKALKQEKIEPLIDITEKVKDIRGVVNKALEEINSWIPKTENEIKSKLEVIDEFRKEIIQLKNKWSELRDPRVDTIIQEVKKVVELIPEEISIVAGSPNVKIKKEGNEYSIAVETVSVGGGISKSAVQKLIDAAVEGISADVDLTNYYTKSEVDSISANLQSQLEELQTYTHIQSVGNSTWTISHNFGRLPANIFVLDSANTEIYGEIQNPDNNTTLILFGSAISGKAILTPS